MSVFDRDTVALAMGWREYQPPIYSRTGRLISGDTGIPPGDCPLRIAWPDPANKPADFFTLWRWLTERKVSVHIRETRKGPAAQLYARRRGNFRETYAFRYGPSIGQALVSAAAVLIKGHRDT